MLDKLNANREFQACHRELFVFASADFGIERKESIHVPAVDELLAPIMYSVVVQLLSYHIAVTLGVDVD